MGRNNNIVGSGRLIGISPDFDDSIRGSVDKILARRGEMDKGRLALEDKAAGFEIGDTVSTLFGQAEILGIDGGNVRVRLLSGKLEQVALSSINKVI